MVLDQWQASLMRALAKLQLQSDPRVRQRLEQSYSLEDEGESAVDEAPGSDGDGEDGEGEGRKAGGKKVPKRQKRRQARKGQQGQAQAQA